MQTQPITPVRFKELPGMRWDATAGTDTTVAVICKVGDKPAIMPVNRTGMTAADVAVMSHPAWIIGSHLRCGRPPRVKREAHLSFAVEDRSDGTYVRLAGRRRDSAKRCNGKTEAILIGLSGGEAKYSLVGSGKAAIDRAARELRQFLCRCVPTTEMRSVVYGSVHGSVTAGAILIDDESLQFTIDDNASYQIAGDVDCWDVSEQF